MFLTTKRRIMTERGEERRGEERRGEGVRRGSEGRERGKIQKGGGEAM